MTMTPALQTTRFDFVRKLGEGGMGVVYEVIDREREVRLALKTFRAMNANALLRFKTEYRLLKDLQHRNLVALGDLFVEDKASYFTMELVSGVPFLRWVRDDELFDADEQTSPGISFGEPQNAAAGFVEERLRPALLQLAEGLAFLHSTKRVHRDIKPSNILVTSSGRVVILDFGLVTYTDERQTRSRFLVGSELYMAPEQAAMKPVGPEADWYGVGVVLYQSLTGVLPFVGRPKRVLELKQTARPIAPRELCPDVPKDLDELCMDLLSAEPQRRPKGREVLRRLGHSEPDIATGDAEALFVGRSHELSLLMDAFLKSRFGNATSILLHGESGIGKSALVRKFSETLRAEHPNAVLLSGTCRERESVPYKAIDGVIDDLSRHLAARPPAEIAELLPPEMGQLAETFPVLQRIPTVSRLETESRSPREAIAPALGAIREILRRLSQHQPVVITVEDLQWADHDGLNLLREILQPPDEPRLLFVGTMRRPPDSGSGVDSVADFASGLGGQVVPVEVKGLPLADSTELAKRLLAGDGRASGQTAEAIAREGAGHPLYIDELARSQRLGDDAGAPLDVALQARIQSLDASARELLNLVAVAGAPISPETAARATAIEIGALHDPLARLGAASLLRTNAAGHWDSIEPCHDRVREIVLAELSPSQRAAYHDRLASALEGCVPIDAEALAIHFAEARNRAKAIEYAVIAADQAARSRAFHRAARFYRVAIELDPDGVGSPELRLKLANALADAGRGAEAGQAFLDAADGRDAEESLELRRRGADQFLRANCVQQGESALAAVLSAAGLKSAGASKGGRWSRFRLRMAVRLQGFRFRERAAAAVPRLDLIGADACFCAATGFGIVDTRRGAEFQARNVLLSLHAGEPSRVALALGLEACFSAAGGSRASGRTAHALAEGQRVAERVGDPFVSARLVGSAGVAAFLEGRWRAAADQLDRAGQMLKDRCTGVGWERDAVQTFTLNALAYLGEARELARRAPRFLLDAQQRSSPFSSSTGEYGTFLDLVSDDPEAARRRSASALARWSRRGWHLENYQELRAQCEIDLYQGNARAAYERVSGQWRDATESFLMRVQLIRINLHALRMRAALAVAAAEKDAQALAWARRDARRVRAEGAAWASPLAHLALAGVANLEGNQEESIAALRRAEQGFEQSSMQLHAAVSRLRMGQLMRDGRGPELLTAAEGVLLREGVRRPASFARMLSPGFAG
jgi:serine/threonine protein kinase